MEATLLHYLKGEAEREIPVWHMISMPEQAIEQKAQSWAAHLRTAGVTCSVVPGELAIGGGSLPGETLPTHLLAIPLTELLAGKKAALLRQQPTPVIARVEAGVLLLDPRTVLEAEEQVLLELLSASSANPRSFLTLNCRTPQLSLFLERAYVQHKI